VPFPNKEQRQANRQAYKEGQGQLKSERGRVIAKFSPGLTSIKLYANGNIVSSMHGAGSAIGAVAKVDQSGAKHVIRDTRQSYLTIEGPHVSIAAKLGSNSGFVVTAARKFAAAVNQWSQSHAGSSAAGPARLAPAPAEASNDTLGQLERLVKLRDSGALTEEEFLSQKARLLDGG
jgi:hypothetical protein